jgi:hypothetical protein
MHLWGVTRRRQRGPAVGHKVDSASDAPAQISGKWLGGGFRTNQLLSVAFFFAREHVARSPPVEKAEMELRRTRAAQNGTLQRRSHLIPPSRPSCSCIFLLAIATDRVSPGRDATLRVCHHQDPATLPSD